MWQQASTMTGALADTDRARATGAGGALSTEQGLALFDTALGRTEAHLVPIPLDLTAVRNADPAAVPALLRGLVSGRIRRAVAQQSVAGQALAQQLRAVPEAQQRQILLELVRDSAATVLGHVSADAVGERQAFKDLGFDSLTAVELRNRLNAATGLRLPATLVFDHPTSEKLVEFLAAELLPRQEMAVAALLLDKLQEVEAGLARTADADARTKLVRRLESMLAKYGGDDGAQQSAGPSVVDALDRATDDEMFAFIDRELGDEQP
jgi:acyl carrier protein